MEELQIDMNDDQVGQKIRELRRERGYRSGVDFAEDLGLSKSALYRYESGDAEVDLDFVIESTITLDFNQIEITKDEYDFRVTVYQTSGELL